MNRVPALLGGELQVTRREAEVFAFDGTRERDDGAARRGALQRIDRLGAAVSDGFESPGICAAATCESAASRPAVRDEDRSARLCIRTSVELLERNSHGRCALPIGPSADPWT